MRRKRVEEKTRKRTDISCRLSRFFPIIDFREGLPRSSLDNRGRRIFLHPALSSALVINSIKRSGGVREITPFNRRYITDKLFPDANRVLRREQSNPPPPPPSLLPRVKAIRARIQFDKIVDRARIRGCEINKRNG